MAPGQLIDLTPPFRLWADRRIKGLRRAEASLFQRRHLLSLVKRAASTRFGRQHRFDRIDSVEAYQKSVPLRDYNDFWETYWKNSFPIIIDATWPGRIPYFAVSSGTTTGRSKYIPVTRAMLRHQRRTGYHVLGAHVTAHPESRSLSGKIFMLGGSTSLVEQAPGVKSGDLSGVITAQAPSILRPLAFPPLDIALLDDWDEKLNRLVDAMAGQNITVLGGIPSWLLILIDRLEQRYDVSPLRNLELLVHGGVNWAPYEGRFRPFLEKTGASTREVYPASEGFIAFADATPEDGLLLCFDDRIFFEFVPVEELGTDAPTRHWLGNIEPGINYAIVVTTAAGLWSYVLGDTVSFVSVKPPRLLVTGRVTFTLSMFGEHVIETELEQAVAAAATEAGLEITDFMVGGHLPDEQGELGRHVYLIETARPADAGIVDALSSSIDETLGRLNDDYAAHRHGGTGLDRPQVELLPPGRFAEWMRRRGKLGGQHKVPRVVSDPENFEKTRTDLVGERSLVSAP